MASPTNYTQAFRLAGKTLHFEVLRPHRRNERDFVYLSDVSAAFDIMGHAKTLFERNGALISFARDAGHRIIKPERVPAQPRTIIDIRFQESALTAIDGDDRVLPLQVVQPINHFQTSSLAAASASASAPTASTTAWQPAMATMSTYIMPDSQPPRSPQLYIGDNSAGQFHNPFQLQHRSGNAFQIDPTAYRTFASNPSTTDPSSSTTTSIAAARMRDNIESTHSRQEADLAAISMLRNNKDAFERIALALEKAQDILSWKSDDAVLEKTKSLRLFVILPSHLQSTPWDPLDVTKNSVRVHFLCECPSSISDPQQRQLHLPSNHDGYPIEQPAEFFESYGEYLLAVLDMFRLGVRIGGYDLPELKRASVFGLQQQQQPRRPEITLESIHASIAYIEAINNQHDDDSFIRRRLPKEDERDIARQEWQSYLQRVEQLQSNALDPTTLLPDLNFYRTCSTSGQVKWICQDHYRSLSSLQATVIKDLTKFLAQDSKGKLDLQLGSLSAVLKSSTEAGQFYSLLNELQGGLLLLLFSLDLTLDFHQEFADFGKLKDALLIHRSAGAVLSTLSIDLKNYKSPLTETDFLGRYNPILEILRQPTLTMVDLKNLPSDFWYRTSFHQNHVEYSNLIHLKLDGAFFDDLFITNLEKLGQILVRATNLVSLDMTVDPRASAQVINTVFEARTEMGATTALELKFRVAAKVATGATAGIYAGLPVYWFGMQIPVVSFGPRESAKDLACQDFTQIVMQYGRYIQMLVIEGMEDGLALAWMEVLDAFSGQDGSDPESEQDKESKKKKQEENPPKSILKELKVLNHQLSDFGVRCLADVVRVSPFLESLTYHLKVNMDGAVLRSIPWKAKNLRRLELENYMQDPSWVQGQLLEGINEAIAENDRVCASKVEATTTTTTGFLNLDTFIYAHIDDEHFPATLEVLAHVVHKIKARVLQLWPKLSLSQWIAWLDCVEMSGLEELQLYTDGLEVSTEGGGTVAARRILEVLKGPKLKKVVFCNLMIDSGLIAAAKEHGVEVVCVRQ